jgi:hypothetical protein
MHPLTSTVMQRSQPDCVNADNTEPGMLDTESERESIVALLGSCHL